MTETKKIILDSKSMTKITTTGIMDLAANTCLKMYASLIKGVTDASAVKNGKLIIGMPAIITKKMGFKSRKVPAPKRKYYNQTIELTDKIFPLPDLKTYFDKSIKLTPAV